VAARDLVRRADVTLEVALAIDSPTRVGRPKGQIAISDGRDTVQVTDFTTPVGGGITTLLLDGRQVSVSFTTNLITDDAGFTALEAAYVPNTPAFLLVRTTRAGLIKQRWRYKGFVTGLTLALNESGVAEAAVTFTATHFVNDLLIGGSLVTFGGKPLVIALQGGSAHA